MIRILSESSVAAGVRRIEAVSGQAVEEILDTQQDLVKSLRELFNNTPNLLQSIHRLVDEDNQLKKQIEDFKQEKAQQIKKMLLDKASDVNGFKVVRYEGPAEPGDVKAIAFQMRMENPAVIFVGGTVFQGRPMLTVALGDEAKAAGYSASDLVKGAAALIQGGGGGQPHFAQAGGKNLDGLSAAVQQILDAVKK
jgi:alanyl-tRNA synthetase